MTDIVTLTNTAWDQQVTPGDQELAIDALERGCVLLFPHLGFPIQEDEARLLSPAIVGKGKNVSLDPATGTVRGSSAEGAELQALQKLMMRYAVSTRSLMRGLFPSYEAGLEQARTSFRPAEISGRQTSWRKDDTRLHVDSFPSSPTQGNRILRVFVNINPQGRSRRWRLGEPFEAVARRYLPRAPAPVWGADLALEWLRITKRRRTAYDHYMLQLHDRMKADEAYQAEVSQRAFEFQAGCAWMVYTDQASHAAMSGQYALEQTFHLPISSMRHPARAPLRILEGLVGRQLA
jgi:hypothetical protein